MRAHDMDVYIHEYMYVHIVVTTKVTFLLSIANLMRFVFDKQEKGTGIIKKQIRMSYEVRQKQTGKKIKRADQMITGRFEN